MILYEDIFKEFQKRKVKYVLVGGLAVNLQGTLRATYDLDILVDMTNANLAKVVTILKDKGYTVRQPVDPMNIANQEIREDWIRNKNMKAFNFFKDDEYKQVDIIIESPVTYARAHKFATIIRVDGVILPVMSIDHLIEMKQMAGRDKDLLDIKELRMIKRLRKNK